MERQRERKGERLHLRLDYCHAKEARSANLVGGKRGKESNAQTTDKQPYEGGTVGIPDIYNGRGRHVNPVNAQEIGGDPGTLVLEQPDHIYK